MEYILNKTPIRTSNNFNINDFKIDLDIKKTNYNDFKISNDKVIIKKEIKRNFTSRIGLDNDEYLNLDIKIDNIKEPLLILYDFDNNSYLTSVLNLTIENNANVIIVFNSKNEAFLNTKIVIKAKDNSNSNISIVNLLSNDSKSFISIENNIYENANSIVNFIELGSKIKVSNYYSMINGRNGKNYFNSLYYGKDDEKIDLNYYIGNNNKNTISNIIVEGTLNNKAHKSFKGTIDFYEGSSKSIGEEKENCTLLSDEAVSKSLPMLLCHEEDVEGAHGVSTGKIDEDILFYLMSRGIDEKDSKKLIINSNFNKVINNIPDDNIKNIIIDNINKKL